MALLSDPISGTLGTILQHGLESKLFAYFRLTYALGLSAAISLLVVTGGALAAGVKPMQAIGSGMVVAGIAMLGTYQASDDARNIKIALTTDVTQQTLDHPTVTIKGDQGK